ncbi:amino acid ABC transporter permease [Collinsella sp. An7]|nr:amino acid ABC transporter permease [Collinsella sp. An7]
MTIPSIHSPRGVRRLSLAFIAIALCLTACLGAFAAPRQALAMDIVRCTGRPNSTDDKTVIQGATQSRITFEASIEEGEGVSALTLTIPPDTTFETEDLAVTLLTGPDLMTRNDVAYDLDVKGQNIILTFDEPLDEAGNLNIIVYGVYFPQAGGDMQVEASYRLADGDEHDVEGIPVIPVQGISPTEALSQWLEQQPWVQAWNANRFLHLFLDPTILVTSFPVVLNGFFMSVAIVALAFPLAIPVALVLALMRMSKFVVWRGIATTYVNLMRGTPLFLQIYVAFFGLPLAGIQIPNFPLGVIVMTLNSGAYMCEIFRAGILAINKGQTEAARSLGMTSTQTMLNVVLPQMFRLVIPNLTSEFITLYKDTSLLAAVGVMELVMYARTIVASTGSITPYIVAAVFYLVITLPLSKVTHHLEQRALGGKRRRRKARAAA